MKAKINLQLLKTTTFDSGAIGLMAMVLHQFRETGHYIAIINIKGRAVTEVEFNVDDHSNNRQLDIDMARAVKDTEIRPESDYKKPKSKLKNIVSPEGYVLFFASSGSGYSANVFRKGKKGKGKEVFDSTELHEGDLFAVTLLEPAQYSMENKLGKASGEIKVGAASKDATQLRKLDTQTITVNEKKIDPKNVKSISSQGLVFQIKGKARILIEKKSTRQKKSKEKPVLHWKKQQTLAKKKKK